ncbi:MAG: thiamine pyrophosphate-binding protein [Chloroflexi bacterium]|nr:thiamine pyrophosphate-binding protein [Chloroflexota bacterium]
MAQMTGGEALAKSLYREGVRVIFGLPGVQMYGIMAALREEPGIRFITTRHEQATGYMADGYARAGGEGGFGTALVVPGPGLLNASAALSTAYSTSSSVLMVSGQVQRDFIGSDVGMLHEVNDQMEAIKPITKFQRRALQVGEIPQAVHDAVLAMKTGRPRPVEIEIPPETLEEIGEAELLEASNPLRPAAAIKEVEKAVEMLAAAKRPVIFAGGGVNLGDAQEELLAVAEFLQAGVVMTAEGKGAIDARHPLAIGSALSPSSPIVEYLQTADLVLAVGTRLVRAGIKPDQQIIQLDIDPEEIGRNYENVHGLAGDAAATLRSLLDGLKASGDPRQSVNGEIATVREAADALAPETQPQGTILAGIREHVPDDTLMISGMTQVGYYSRSHWKTYGPRSFFTSGYSGNLGYAFPTGLGVKVAQPDKPVVITSGDGGFLYSSQELATAVQHGINAVVVLFNDNSYGNVSRDLDNMWGGTYGAELHNPDFVEMAEAYGVKGMKVDEPENVGVAVADAIQMDRPVLIEVPVGRMPQPAMFRGSDPSTTGTR